MTIRTLTAMTALLVASACSTTLQTSSGRDYLARYNDSHQSYADRSGDIDADVRRIAAIEPTLEFPARIGLARIEYGRLATIPGDEAQIWTDVIDEIGADYGEFVPISPMIASMVAEPAPRGMDPSAAVIADIRRGAARQHVDYVVAYEVSSQRQDKANALALADLTIIGMFVLPSRTVEIEASASALMLDVRTGYPYATLTAHAEKTGLSRAVSEYSTTQAYIDTAEERAVAKLAGEFEDALKGLAARSPDRTVAVAPIRETPITPNSKPAVKSPTQRALEAAQ